VCRGLLGAVRADHGLLDGLSENRLLSDVLVDAVVLGARLVGVPGALRAAVDNPAVAYVVSADPGVFDGVGDGELVNGLAGVVRPGWADEGDQGAGVVVGVQGLASADLVRRLSGRAALGALPRDVRNAWFRFGLQSPEIVRALLAHPEALRMPHEYRAFMGDGAWELRGGLTAESPLFEGRRLWTELRGVEQRGARSNISRLRELPEVSQEWLTVWRDAPTVHALGWILPKLLDSLMESESSWLTAYIPRDPLLVSAIARAPSSRRCIELPPRDGLPSSSWPTTPRF
jgi:hypothetical protein